MFDSFGGFDSMKISSNRIDRIPKGISLHPTCATRVKMPESARPDLNLVLVEKDRSSFGPVAILP